MRALSREEAVHGVPSSGNAYTARAHGAQHQPYTVKAFTIQIFDPGGNLSKSISLPMQSGHESIVYQITI